MVKTIIVVLCGGEISKKNYWRSVERLKKGVELYKKYSANYLMISSGNSGHQTLYLPESHQYWRYLCKHWPLVDQEKVLIEDLSRDTVGNVYFSMLALRALISGGRRVIWVTNKFHMRRLKFIVGVAKRSNETHIFCELNSFMQDESKVLLLNELNSLKKFKADFKKYKTMDKLIFRGHSFYSIFRKFN